MAEIRAGSQAALNGRRFSWPDGRLYALSLTYDDGLAVHRETVAPLLEARRLRASFYPVISGDVLTHFEEWKQLAARGHELGNHTLFHPCRRDQPGKYPWLDDGFDLCQYTPYRFQMEVKVANTFLNLLDGRNTRTYGATCCDMHVGRGPQKTRIVDLLGEEFVAIRSSQIDRPLTVSADLDLRDVGHCAGDHRSLGDLLKLTRAAREVGGWVVIHVHAVGDCGNDLFMDGVTHDRYLDALANDSDAWVQPFIKVATWIRRWQEVARS
jgi:hypothetical protein